MTGWRVASLVLLALLVALLGSSYGNMRVAIGGAVALFLISFAFRYWRDVGRIPPDPETTDVTDRDLRYICSMCGLELRVEIAARDRAPTHCGESMELVTGSGRTPLRPV